MMYTASLFSMNFQERHPSRRFSRDMPADDLALIRCDQGDFLGLYFTDVSRTSLLSEQQEIHLGQRIQAGDQEARMELAQANTRLVIAAARKPKYRHRGLENLDLISAGNKGLMKAVDKWRPDRGNRFSTVATWWIRQTIGREISDTGDEIRIPEVTRTNLRHYHRFREQFFSQHEREPTLEEVMEGLRWRRPQAEQFVVVTLPKMVELKGGQRDNCPSPEDIAHDRILSARVRQAVDRLPEDMRTAVLLHWWEEMEWEDIGRKLNIHHSAKAFQHKVFRCLRASPELSALVDEVFPYE